MSNATNNLTDLSKCLNTMKIALKTTTIDLDNLQKEIVKIQTSFNNMKHLFGEKNNLCTICYIKDKSHIFTCGHSFCEDCCNRAIDKCHVCKKRVIRCIKIYDN